MYCSPCVPFLHGSDVRADEFWFGGYLNPIFNEITVLLGECVDL